MNQKDKNLLIQDLCARQMHDLKVNTPKGIFTMDYIRNAYIYMKEMYEASASIYKFHVFPIESCQPYLRSMSSMTEDEVKELLTVSNFCPVNEDIYNGFIRIIERSLLDISDIAIFINWLNANKFDYLGLIPKGLAIEVTKENNPYNK